MNRTQVRILLKLGSLSAMTLILYIILLTNLRNNIDGVQYYVMIALLSSFYLMLLAIIWLRERYLYHDYVMQKRIHSGNLEYLLCPSCKVIQPKGTEICTKCNQTWIICRSCEIPFEPKSRILISPCCGQGFHYDHFEADLRELGHCPYCKSDIPLKTTNW